MRLIQLGMIGFIVLAACVTELVCEKGNAEWGLGYWLIIAFAFWGISGAFRLKRRMEARTKGAVDQKHSEEETQKRSKAGYLMSMAVASGISYWGLVVRYILHGTLWQAVPFYAAGLALLLLWGPRASTQAPAN